MSRAVAAIAGMLASTLLAACTDTRVPMPSFPQLEQTQQTIHGGGERYRIHRACAATVADVEAFVGCMRDAGYGFVARSPEWPAAECWQMRERADPTDLPPPQCFVHAEGASH